MKKRIASNPLLYLFVASACALWAADLTGAGAEQTARGLTLFFIGQRVGEIEPCGCRVNQRGGLQYEAALYEQVPRAQSLRTDAGGWSRGSGDPAYVMRTRYALRAFGGHLDLDAVNAGTVDLYLGRDYFLDLAEKHPEALEPIVSANVYDAQKDDALFFNAYRVVERTTAAGDPVKVGLTGATSPTSALFAGGPRPPDFEENFTIADPTESLKPVLAELNEKTDLTVLLFYGTWQEAELLLADVEGVDFMVLPSYIPEAPQGFREVGDATALRVQNNQGKVLGRAELARGESGDWKLAAPPQYLDVSVDLPAAQAMVELIDEFKNQTVEMTVERPRTVKRTFAGARACASCHLEEYKDWRETPHSRAYQTLVEKGSQFDAKCLQCHTLGFQQDNGFWNIRQSRHMTDVQCESCHGAAYEHVQRENFIRNGSIESLEGEAKESYLAAALAARPSREVPAATCLECHTPENDDHFDYDLKVVKIDHDAETGAK